MNASPSLQTDVTFNKNKIDLNAYFERISYAGSTEASFQTLSSIHRAHAAAIPFENLNPLLRLPVVLDIDSIQTKLISQGRGGYCFEQNTLLGYALKELGFTVRGLAARVLWNIQPGLNPARGHMLLLITIGGNEYIADVGFGGMTLPQPLMMVPDIYQQTSHETFRLRKSSDEFMVEVRLQDEWKPLYRFTTSEHFPSDYEVANYYLSTNPNSHFLHNLLAARIVEGERFALRNKEFSTYPTNGPAEKRIIETIAELKHILTTSFNITLPAAPNLDETLARIVEKN